MTKSTKKIRRGAGRVAFLAERAAIADLVTKGHPLRMIFDEYQDRLGIGYPQFTRYVNRYIRSENNGRNTGASNQAGQGTAATARQGGTAQQVGPASFQFDPRAGHNRDDLI